MNSNVGAVIRMEAGKAILEGRLSIPPNCLGLVLLVVEKEADSQHSHRQEIAQKLSESGLATLLVDLLSIADIDRERPHDFGLLADRLIGVTNWLENNPATRSFRLGYLGTSTGAGAALVAAAARPGLVGAVVSCAGRPNLVDTTLAKVEAPTLLIVGGNDDPAIQANQAALSLLHCQKHLEIVPGVAHLFETPDAVAAVANLALRWFKKYLPG